MREPILKAVAMPPKVFWAPMIPSIVNIAVQSVFLCMWIASRKNPIFFIVTIALAHIAIVIYGVKEPHLSRMMQASGPMMSPSKNVYRSRGNKLAP
ncbi:MAG: hypothetical protein IKV03_05330 [Alphaproteobacteria bacterium]|nr:hypothetical protein [Alphaproteobacteria bacterium]